jgi:hypothetical protein
MDSEIFQTHTSLFFKSDTYVSLFLIIFHKNNPAVRYEKSKCRHEISREKIQDLHLSPWGKKEEEVYTKDPGEEIEK